MLVRTDIPLADQIVQVGHACLEAGHRFEQPTQPCHLIVLAVSSRNHLLDALAQLELQGIRFALFYEPDNNLGHTAACSEPVGTNLRRLFRRFPLWSETMISHHERGPPAQVGISPVLSRVARSGQHIHSPNGNYSVTTAKSSEPLPCWRAR